MCYPSLSSIVVLSDEKVWLIDSALRKPEIIAQKVHDFAVNEAQKQGGIQGIAIISKKK